MSQNRQRAGKAERDDYIKSEKTEHRLGLTGDQQPTATDDAELQLYVTRDEVRQTAKALADLDWRHGLTRDELRMAYHDLPLGIYLRLPDSKHFASVGEVLHEAGVAASRAEGDFMGAHPDYPVEESLEDGGPPGWSDEDPLFIVNARIDGGSAEDHEEGETESGEPTT